MNPADKLIIALDVDTKEKALSVIDTLVDDVKLFKIGLELFTSCGPTVIKYVQDKGCRIFLDLKYHDIPNTVSKSAVCAARLGVFMFNVHSLGGYDMMKKTALAVRQEADRLNIIPPKIIAVTILTSMDEMALKSVGIGDTMNAEVLRLAKLAKGAGLDGVVASASEIKILRENFGEDFLIVTPGVRPEWVAGSDDQKRIATPKQAIKDGASFIVVGRPVTEAGDKKEAVKKILDEIKS